MEGYRETEREKMDVREAAICACVCVFVCLCAQVQGRDGGGEREKVDAREIRQVRGSGGGRAREAGCEGGNGMCVCCVRVRGSDGGRATEDECEGGSDLCACAGARERWMEG